MFILIRCYELVSESKFKAWICDQKNIKVGIDVDQFGFQQDGATCHTIKLSGEKFGERIQLYIMYL